MEERESEKLRIIFEDAKADENFQRLVAGTVRAFDFDQEILKTFKS